MYYVFKDKENSPTAVLLNRLYKGNVIYSKGIGTAKTIIKEMLALDENVEIALFMDAIPGNRSIASLYESFITISSNFDNRLIVLPIVCSEYYCLKAFGNVEDSDINICINKESFMGTETYKNNKNYCKTFEKYCKLLAREKLPSCASHITDEDGNEKYMLYYSTGCTCNTCKYEHLKHSITYKAIKLASELDVIPSTKLSAANVHKLTRKDVVAIHRKLVDDYNKLAETLEASDKSGRSYIRFRYQNLDKWVQRG